MKKNCAKCQAEFDCRVDDISSCHCSAVQLSKDSLDQLAEQYDNCLCAKCLIEFSNDPVQKINRV